MSNEELSITNNSVEWASLSNHSTRYFVKEIAIWRNYIPSNKVLSMAGFSNTELNNSDLGSLLRSSDNKYGLALSGVLTGYFRSANWSFVHLHGTLSMCHFFSANHPERCVSGKYELEQVVEKMENTDPKHREAMAINTYLYIQST